MRRLDWEEVAAPANPNRMYERGQHCAGPFCYGASRLIEASIGGVMTTGSSEHLSVKDLLAKSDDELFGQLWEDSSLVIQLSVLTHEVGILRQASASFRDIANLGTKRQTLDKVDTAIAIERGKKLFNGMKPRIEQQICAEWGACQRLSEIKYADEGQLVAVICDVLSAKLTGLPVVTVSALVMRIGVKNFCKCE